MQPISTAAVPVRHGHPIMAPLDLPNYFLIDIPIEARLNPAMLREALRQIKRNRRQYIRDMSTDDVVKILARLADNWRDNLFPFRQHALEHGPKQMGFSRETLSRGLDQFFERITEDSLHNLLAQEFGDARRLDTPAPIPEERVENRMALAIGPELIGHITAGNLPCPALMSMIHGLLIGSAQFIKCARATGFLPRLFAHSIYEAHGKFGACIEIAEWEGGRKDLEQELFEEADCITATGRDETLADIRSRLPRDTVFLGHGHRVSFGFLTKDVTTRALAREQAHLAADDIAAWNQLGCLSPHAFYVQRGGALGAEKFAELLAEALAEKESTEPRGELTTADAANIADLRSLYETRAANVGDVRLWQSEESTAWTVIYDREQIFRPSCLNRFVFVKEVEDLEEALRTAEMIRGQVSTVGLAATKLDAADLVRQLAHWGVTRVCPIGQMQNPPLTWRHDGRPALADYVRWTDWEL
ncbi:MAG: hypothetical protein CMO66_06085 [Verrucomicrobiales bacterium]|nr:hypothetical protein [Verrucomicrobiales bacterium]